MTAEERLNRRELARYLQRVSDRWPVERALAAEVAELPGLVAEDATYVVVFVSRHFDGVPWLERVRQAENLWDAAEMGGSADVHCYTPVEFERKREQLEVVDAVARRGVDLVAGDS